MYLCYGWRCHWCEISQPNPTQPDGVQLDLTRHNLTDLNRRETTDETNPDNHIQPTDEEISRSKSAKMIFVQILQLCGHFFGFCSRKNLHLEPKRWQVLGNS